jgi:hypothetical protein
LIAFSLPPLTLDIADGDIAAETTDAVVNAANNAFWMGSRTSSGSRRWRCRRLARASAGFPATRPFAEVAAELFSPPLDGPPECPVSR